ncbi:MULTISPECIES: thiamine phosphate synthase [Aminobacterium]|jgi:thiamine-phosphate pyrophosphorylase|uniref:Thiamine-phosphate synthase n=1 Tax=Aminobacterium colombiense (strain DSM 12261 / ALA-1) TaxID=572547 RepID=D5ECX0_AMICL|nr:MULTISPECIES: thiamine phosphate synthase [Aminobacterium]MDD2379203.1 thiamine phosphate synthase [Aminobacterium colombiense]ADE56402.1 thiamine-phosphate pyrophosphorylase [Aminobacterium colombiense DSM 12261]MDD3768679.1 thiamine phosphate synthase [Aminobacterium colombiense]MDD4265436.1 thiamine phosphate synthase [Aminobacterium colombiense]MDD4586133.1 thiamine phosphate synthase [Aminobacterium colombiense]
MNIRHMLKLYVIPDRQIGAPRTLLEQTEEVLKGGATVIQLRDKQSGGRELLETALAMKRLCYDYNVPLIINDRLDVALAAQADGVHLGQKDLPLEAVRPFLPRGFIVGVSAHTVDQARIALKSGASYIGIGAAFPTGSKEDAHVVGLSRIREIMEAVPIPAVAIGGINEENVAEAMKTGVNGVAVISAIVGAPHIKKAARHFLSLIS